MSNLSSIHDTFIRALLADKRMAIDYFKSCLPAEVLGYLDFTTLTQLPDTYVSGELRKTVSDIVYACGKRAGSGEVRISLLVEHKSTPYRYTPVQIGSYIFSGFLKQIGNRERLSPIIPILLYHGRKKWEYKTLRDFFTGYEPEFLEFLPDYEYIYHNLSGISDEKFGIVENSLLRASFLVLKHTFEPRWLEENASRLLEWLEEGERNLQTEFIVYLFKRSGMEEAGISGLITSLSPGIKETVMNTLEIFVGKGEKIGLEKGKEIGLEIGRREGSQKKAEQVVRNLIRASGLNDEQIAVVAEVPLATVLRIRGSLEKEG